MKSIFKVHCFWLLLIVMLCLFIPGVLSCRKDTIKEPTEDPITPPEIIANFSTADSILISSGDSADVMRILNFFEYEDSLILRSISTNIVDYDDDLLDLLIDRMYSTMKNAGGIGIAAPQVGILKRVIWVKRYDEVGSPFEVYINPVITDYSDTLKLRNDGCLSIPGVNGQSYRYIWVEVEYYLPDKTKHTEKITHEFTAHIFQHEIDHLEGIVFLDRMDEPKKSGKTYIDNVILDGLLK